MHIAFIAAYNYRLPYQVSLPPLGVGYLSAMIKKECPGVEVSFHMTIDRLLETKPDIVGISAATENFGDAIEMARMAKEYCAPKVIVGGMHVTSLPHALPRVFDCGVVGEGEMTFVELIKLYQAVEKPTPADYAKIPGICFHQTKWTQVNPGRELIRDLDDLPYPDREVLGDGWKVPYGEQVHLISSRGCPYDCSFCSSSLHWKRFRYFSPDYTADEIEWLRDRYNPREFYFFDDLFIANRKRFRAICEKFKERGLHKDVVFRSYARVDLVDEELADLFEEYNFVFIDFGFESNAQPTLDYFRKRNVTPEINQRAIDMLKGRRVSVGANIIIGSPPETDETLDETIAFIERNKDHIGRFSMGPLLPLPGTPIWAEAVQRGLVSDNMTDWERLGFEPDNFDITRYPFMCDGMDRDHFYRRYLDFRALTKEVNLMGQIRKIEYQRQYLQRELDTMRGSRLMNMAAGLRGMLRETLEVFSPKPEAATPAVKKEYKKSNIVTRRPPGMARPALDKVNESMARGDGRLMEDAGPGGEEAPARPEHSHSNGNGHRHVNGNGAKVAAEAEASAPHPG